MFLISMFLFIPIPFLTIWFEKGDYDFPHHEVSYKCAFLLKWVIKSNFYLQCSCFLSYHVAPD